MTPKALRDERMVNQQISGTKFLLPGEMVQWMVAMQSQLYDMAKWAIGLRLSHSTNAQIEESFNKGEILRTHVLRPTWHFVHPADIRWLLQLTGPRVQAFNKMYYKRQELDPATFKKSNDILLKTLQGGKQLTRTALQDALKRGKIKVQGIRLAFVMMQAELDGLICSGGKEGKQFTYALLEERAPAARSFLREESMLMLTERYFKSRGPATANDFAWWSGLTISECREAISGLQSKMISEKWNGQTFYFMDLPATKLKTQQRTFVMPDYDEYGIAYKDRSVLFDDKIISQEKFKEKRYPHAIVIDGVIVGSWKINKKSEGRNKFIVFDFQIPSNLPTSKQSALRKAVQRFQTFTNLMI